MIRSLVNQRPVYHRDPDETLDGDAAVALPAACMRVLHSPCGDVCPSDCPGRQEDGTCLTEVVREAWAETGEWPRFDLDRFDRWVRVG